jgi:hypothetical protein
VYFQLAKKLEAFLTEETEKPAFPDLPPSKVTLLVSTSPTASRYNASLPV